MNDLSGDKSGFLHAKKCDRVSDVFGVPSRRIGVHPPSCHGRVAFWTSCGKARKTPPSITFGLVVQPRAGPRPLQDRTQGRDRMGRHLKCERVPDDSRAVAAIDRLVHHSTIIEINTDSYRRRAAAESAAARKGSTDGSLTPRTRAKAAT